MASASYQRSSDGKLRLTRVEAKEIRDDYARARDFWIYDMETNKELLQAALDILHNSIEGNYYYVDYMDSQNGCRLIITCDPCNKQLSSYDPFMSHDLGKNHKKSIQQRINKLEAERISHQEVSFKPMNSPKEIFDPDSLEDMIDHCTQRVLGLQFLYKERLHGFESSYKYSCQLCGETRLKKKAMFAHLTEDTLHNRKYLLAKFGRRISTSDAYANKCKETETLEGKICHTIVDFTQQFEMLRRHHGSTPPASPPPSPTRQSSPVRQPMSPPAPLVTHAEVQVDTDELDMQFSLTKEMAMMKLNGGDEHLSKDFESIELMLETLQTLNLKMHSFYSRSSDSRSLMHNTGKFQSYVYDSHKKLKRCMSEKVSTKSAPLR